jgi:hypothetical protein
MDDTARDDNAFVHSSRKPIQRQALSHSNCCCPKTHVGLRTTLPSSASGSANPHIFVTTKHWLFSSVRHGWRGSGSVMDSGHWCFRHSLATHPLTDLTFFVACAQSAFARAAPFRSLTSADVNIVIARVTHRIPAMWTDIPVVCRLRQGSAPA